MDMNQILTSGLSDLLYVVGMFVLGLIGNFAHKYTQATKTNNKQTELTVKNGIIETIVTAVDRIYYDFDGKDKFVAATEMISKDLKEHGLSMTSDQIQTAIEATVEKLRKQVQVDSGTGL